MTADALPTRHQGTAPLSRRELRERERALAEQALADVTPASLEAEAFVPRQVSQRSSVEPAPAEAPVVPQQPSARPAPAPQAVQADEPEAPAPQSAEAGPDAAPDLAATTFTPEAGWEPAEVPELEPLPFAGPGAAATPAAFVDAFGSPAELMDAPVQPALPPLDVVQREILSLEERIAALPVAPWAVDLPDLVVGEPLCEPIAAAPSPAERRPTGDARATTPARTAAPRPAPRRPGPVPPSDDLLVRPPSPPQAVWGAWLGVAAIAIWAIGPIALGLGVWSLNAANREGHGKGRPVTALVGGAIGTLMGALFLAIGL